MTTHDTPEAVEHVTLTNLPHFDPRPCGRCGSVRSWRHLRSSESRDQVRCDSVGGVPSSPHLGIPAVSAIPEAALDRLVKAEEWRLANHPDCHWHDYGEADEDGPPSHGKCVPVLQVIRSLNAIRAALASEP
jgi:hypothetical protein